MKKTSQKNPEKEKVTREKKMHSSLTDTGMDPFSPQSEINPAEILMGVNLPEKGIGATCKVWAPTAEKVYLAYGASLEELKIWKPANSFLLSRDENGYWYGYFPLITDGTRYLFYTIGPGGKGFKRDPRARELEIDGYPDYITEHPTHEVPYCPCIVRYNNYRWHDQDFKMPPYHQLIIYQLHIGTFYAWDGTNDIRPNRVSKFLDAIDQLEHLANLGINAIQLLPVVEWQGPFSMGYNNTDFFSPEMDYAVSPAEIQPYLAKVNDMLLRHGKAPLPENALDTQVNQLKAFVDLCHAYGIAVIFDVVYNHGGGPFDPQSMRFFDQQELREWWQKDSYFISGDGWAGGRIFDYAANEVRQFLIDNAKMYLDEYHADGFRYDEISVIVNHHGAQFCRDITSTLRYHKPKAIQNAEYWNYDRARPVENTANGLGFDVTLNDRLREAIRGVIAQSSAGASAFVNMDQVRDALHKPPFFPAHWKAVNYIESHDVVKADRDDPSQIEPRVPKLANGINSHDWYARSRTRVATGMLLAAPGVPMLFMGQEIMEDKPWHTNPAYDQFLIHWSGLQDADGVNRDFFRFTSDLCKLRRLYPAMCGEGVNPYYTHNDNRIIAWQRWVQGEGQDVVVVASLNENNFTGYRLPFPLEGYWHEVFNSDAYDNMDLNGGFNPYAVGNSGGIMADQGPMQGLQASAEIVIPANSLLVFARNRV